MISEPAACSTQRVLLVEASPDGVLLVRAMRDEHDYFETATAASLREAVAAVELSPPACILLDLPLGDADASEAVLELHRASPATPVVVLTHLDDESRGLEAMRAGAHDYVVKDRVDGVELGRVIRRAIVSEAAEHTTADSETALKRRRRLTSQATLLAAVLGACGLGIAISGGPGRVSLLEALLGLPLLAVVAAAVLRWAHPEGGAHHGGDHTSLSVDLADHTIVPQDLRGEVDRAFAAISEGAEITFESRRLHRDGGEIDVAVTLRPLGREHGRATAASAVAVRVSPAVRALERAEERFRGAFQHAPAGMGIVSLDPASYGRLLQVNPALCELAGRREEALLGTTLTSLLEPDGGSVEDDVMGSLLGGEHVDVARRLVRGDGTAVWVQLGASVIRDGADRPVYGLAQVQDITGRKAVEEAQAHLAAIIGSSMDAIVATDARRHITAWNRGAERLLGRARDQVIGREFSLLFPEEDRHREREFLDRALAGDASEPHAALMRMLDGTLVEVSLSMSPIHDSSGDTVGASAIARSLTSSAAGTAAIHANERRLRQIVETANEGIWTLDADWNTTFANQKMAEILSTTVEAMFGTSVFSYYDEEKRADARRALADRRDGQRDQFETSLRRCDGAEASVLMSASGLFDAGGEVTGALAMVADITVRRQAEREVAQWQRLEGLGQLAGGVAHDMNNLLGVILNFSDFGLDVVGDGPGGEELSEIRQAAQRAAALTSQLLIFARQEVVSHQAFDMNALLDDLEKLLRRTIGDHIVLVSRHEPALPAVKADPGFFEQVVINLVVNSRDAMPGGGEITITTAHVTVDEAAGRDGDLPKGDYVRLAVSDEGEGMTEGVAARAFEPFFTTKPVGSGTGLGLATVYGAVTKAGGRVELHSELGEGTTVSLFVPVATEGVEPVADSPEPEPEPEAAAQGKVLLVEDDDGLRRVTVRILEADGYDVLVADGSQAGLELAQEHGDELDAIVTDVVMPDMSGPEMAGRIAESFPDLPVLFVSGYTDRPHALPEGALFLRKPFARAELLREVSKATCEPARPGSGNASARESSWAS